MMPTETDVTQWIEECLRLGWIAERWNDAAGEHEYALTDAGRRHLHEVAPMNSGDDVRVVRGEHT